MPARDRAKRRAAWSRWYRKHRGVHAAHQRKYRQAQTKRSQEWLREYKTTLICSRCPENHPATLDFHHHADDKKHSVGDMARHGYSIKAIQKEIAKCEVLCANCHRKEHFGLMV